MGSTQVQVMPVDMTADHEVGLDNYVVAGKPFTWSAFTFKQMVPQKVSWVIMRQNHDHDANAIIQGAQRSRNGNVVQCVVS